MFPTDVAVRALLNSTAEECRTAQGQEGDKALAWKVHGGVCAGPPNTPLRHLDQYADPA